MRKLQLYIAQSLDGFIAKPNGNLDWLSVEKEVAKNENDYGCMEFLSTVDTTLMGYNTYREVLNFGIPFPYPDKINYVFSRNHKKTDNNPVEFISSDVVDFVKDLKKLHGKDIWLIGGGQINRLLLDAGLIDEMIVTVKSIVLGNGIPLFETGKEISNYKFQKVKKFDNNFIQYILEKK